MMKKSIVRIIWVSLSLFFVLSCSNKEENFFRGELKQIEFADEYHVQEEFFKTDSIGNLSIHIAGDYLMLKTFSLPYFARIYDKNTREYLGNFFYEGNGPQDFLSFRITYIEMPYIYVSDIGTKLIKKINLQETVTTGKTIVEKEYPFRKVIHPLLCFYLSDETLLIKDFEAEGKGLYYMKYNSQSELISGDPILLYNSPVTYRFMNKIATLGDCIKPDGSKIAFITGVFNQVDIVDIDHPENNVSVTVSDQVVEYDYVVDKDNEELNDYYITSPCCSQDLIFVSYANHSNRESPNEIHVIDWHGNPKFKLMISRYLTALSFDFEEGVLYGLSGERVYRYDIKDILAKY